MVRPGLAAAALVAAALLAAAPAGASSCALDASQPRQPSAVGAPAARAAMDALLSAARAAEPAAAAPAAWRFETDGTQLASLMFDTADIAVVTAPFGRAELVPYQHQFQGDMMNSPWLVQVGWLVGQPLLIASNRRPGAPPPLPVLHFLQAALGASGQDALARAGAQPLDAAGRAAELAKLDGFVPKLDEALAPPVLPGAVAGPIRSVGSDGMKSLMDSWVCRLHALRPAVTTGDPWEHLGTLNGWNALLVGAADVAPMGRELWPQERQAWREVFPQAPAPLEVAVARGGFDTPQRTTAQAVFVNPANPLRALSLDQLRGVLDGDVTRWGQLGLGGDWAERPIVLRMPPRMAPNATSMQASVLGDRSWRTDAVEGSIADTAAAILADPAAIGFGGMEEGAPGLVALALSPFGGGPPVPLDAETASTGRYPLTRLMFLRLPPGPASPALVALIDLILSRDGQARVVASAYYPLSAAEADRERAKLDQYQRENTR